MAGELPLSYTMGRQTIQFCSSQLACLTCAFNSTEYLRQIHVVMRRGSRHQRGCNRHCFVMTFKPGDKGGVAGKPLEVYPGVIGAHIRIDKRSCRIKNCSLLD